MAANKPSIIWSPEARADLSDIWDYYASAADVSVATSVTREIGRVIATLDEYPSIGRARDEVRPGLRSIAASPHVVFYRVRSDIVELLRILDGRRDIGAIFLDE